MRLALGHAVPVAKPVTDANRESDASLR